jgi:hypothetical protein
LQRLRRHAPAVLDVSVTFSTDSGGFHDYPTNAFFATHGSFSSVVKEVSGKYPIRFVVAGLFDRLALTKKSVERFDLIRSIQPM